MCFGTHQMLVSIYHYKNANHRNVHKKTSDPAMMKATSMWYIVEVRRVAMDMNVEEGACAGEHDWRSAFCAAAYYPTWLGASCHLSEHLSSERPPEHQERCTCKLMKQIVAKMWHTCLLSGFGSRALLLVQVRAFVRPTQNSARPEKCQGLLQRQ